MIIILIEFMPLLLLERCKVKIFFSILSRFVTREGFQKKERRGRERKEVRREGKKRKEGRIKIREGKKKFIERKRRKEGETRKKK